MIIDLKPLSMPEAKKYLGNQEEVKVVSDYFDKFSKLSEAKAVSLKEDLQKLNSLKLKETHIIKIVDFLPRDSEDVHKVVNDVSLNEEEVNAILNIVKEY